MAKKDSGCGGCLLIIGIVWAIVHLSENPETLESLTPSEQTWRLVLNLGMAGAGLGGLVWLWGVFDRYRFKLRAHKVTRRLFTLVPQQFLVEPCSRCLESHMELLDVSPNARSIQYRCTHCGKSTRAAAFSEESSAVGLLKAELDAVNSRRAEKAEAFFVTPAAPLPYEQTTREPIPEATRSEVWRRDHGRCVRCGSNQQLQFDHIIPVSKGGATTAPNLQLLCQACNRKKGAGI